MPQEKPCHICKKMKAKMKVKNIRVDLGYETMVPLTITAPVCASCTRMMTINGSAHTSVRNAVFVLN